MPKNLLTAVNDFTPLSLLLTLDKFEITIHQTEAAARRCSVKKEFLEISRNSQENTLARVSFLIKLQALGTKRLWHRCFPVNFVKFLRTLFPKEHLRWLLLIRFFIITQQVIYTQSQQKQNHNVFAVNKKGRI